MSVRAAGAGEAIDAPFLVAGINLGWLHLLAANCVALMPANADHFVPAPAPFCLTVNGKVAFADYLDELEPMLGECFREWLKKKFRPGVSKTRSTGRMAGGFAAHRV